MSRFKCKQSGKGFQVPAYLIRSDGRMCRLEMLIWTCKTQTVFKVMSLGETTKGRNRGEVQGLSLAMCQ